MDNPRTSIQKVRLELESDSTFDVGGKERQVMVELLSDEQIEAVGIDPAVVEVSERLGESNMSDNRLRLIERYLAAHFILTSNIDAVRQVDSHSQSDGESQSYSGDRDYADYRSTSVGQKAVNMDTTGTLEAVGKPTASLSVPAVKRRAREQE